MTASVVMLGAAVLAGAMDALAGALRRARERVVRAGVALTIGLFVRAS